MLFDRKKYKHFAKIQLKGRWGVPVLMSIIIGLILSLFQLPTVNAYIKSFPFLLEAETVAEMQEILESYTPTGYFSNLLGFLEFIVTAILTVAATNVLLKMSRTPEKISFSSFIESLTLWGRAILANIWRSLWIFLWSLLFVIPGIVKSIAYSMHNFIICEYPKMSIFKALNISKLITKGHKAELFVMYLSFIGWILLASITCGIAFIWILPYMQMSFINAYHALMKEALETGILKMEDLA
jgi:uncharacterized membrane protein